MNDLAISVYTVNLTLVKKEDLVFVLRLRTKGDERPLQNYDIDEFAIKSDGE